MSDMVFNSGGRNREEWEEFQGEIIVRLDAVKKYLSILEVEIVQRRGGRKYPLPRPTQGELVATVAETLPSPETMETLLRLLNENQLLRNKAIEVFLIRSSILAVIKPKQVHRRKKEEDI